MPMQGAKGAAAIKRQKAAGAGGGHDAAQPAKKKAKGVAEQQGGAQQAEVQQHGTVPEDKQQHAKPSKKEMKKQRKEQEQQQGQQQHQQRHEQQDEQQHKQPQQPAGNASEARQIRGVLGFEGQAAAPAPGKGGGGTFKFGFDAEVVAQVEADTEAKLARLHAIDSADKDGYVPRRVCLGPIMEQGCTLFCVAHPSANSNLCPAQIGIQLKTPSAYPLTPFPMHPHPSHCPNGPAAAPGVCWRHAVFIQP